MDNSGNFLVVRPDNGKYSSGAKRFTDGTIQHTIFLDKSNTPYILIDCNKVDRIIQIFEVNNSILLIDVFIKSEVCSSNSDEVFLLVESYMYKPFECKKNEIPLLYVKLCECITNMLNKHRVKQLNISNSVLTFKELIELERMYKTKKKIRIRSGNKVVIFDCTRYTSLNSLEDSITLFLDTGIVQEENKDCGLYFFSLFPKSIINIYYINVQK